MKILVTGFKPFLKEKINPSEKLANQLKQVFDHVESLILPVEFENSFEILKKKIEEIKPDHVIMMGQASGRQNVCLEKIGLNWIQSEHKDEAEILPKTGRIIPDVELALMTSFPVDAIFLHLKKAQLPVEISFSAGSYVCNDLYFRVLNYFKNIKAVFVHVPLMPEQLKHEDDRPSLEFASQFEVLRSLISSLGE